MIQMGGDPQKPIWSEQWDVGAEGLVFSKERDVGLVGCRTNGNFSGYLVVGKMERQRNGQSPARQHQNNKIYRYGDIVSTTYLKNIPVYGPDQACTTLYGNIN